MDFPVLYEETGQLMEYRQLCKHSRYATTWTTSYSNDMGRLCQGIVKNTEGTGKSVEGTDTFFVVHYHDIPANKRKEITYTLVVCKVRPQKEDPDRTQITISGNRIYYPVDVGTPTASLELFELLVNSYLSRNGARFVCFYIKNFYLGTPLDRPEYAHIHRKDIPKEFIAEYNHPVHRR